MNTDYDIIIIGGGVAGLSVANALKSTNLRILLLERKVSFTDVNRGDTLYPHSLDILENWNVLKNLLDKNPVKSDKVSIFQNNRDLADINIISQNRQKNKFLLSLNHELIEQSLYESLKESNNIEIQLGSNVLNLNYENDLYTSLVFNIKGEHKLVSSKIFIACDGRDSQLRKKASIDYSTLDFNHSIVILDSDTPENYNNHTWFYYGKYHEIIIGPLPNNKARLSIILKREECNEWMMMNEEELNQKVKEESEIFKTCKVTKSESHLYDIKMSLSDRFYDKNLIFLGDSAHTVHPLSGQGMALAISDADTFANEIRISSDGNYLEIIKKFAENRRKIIQSLQEHVANLGNLLVSEDKLVDMARIFLINSLETLPMFERQIEAMLQSEIEKF